MSNETITRADLVAALIKKTGLSHKDSVKILGEVLGEIAGCLVKGEPVRIYAFASFSVRHKKKRMVRNP